MRKQGKWYKNGDERTVRKFLWTPLTIYRENQVTETRWLEWVTIFQIYRSGGFSGGWSNRRFIDD